MEITADLENKNGESLEDIIIDKIEHIYKINENLFDYSLLTNFLINDDYGITIIDGNDKYTWDEYFKKPSDVANCLRNTIEIYYNIYYISSCCSFFITR